MRSGRRRSRRRPTIPAHIEDYAVIGDTHTAALISRDGSLDWLCLPRFDSPACFAALVGATHNGRWLLGPAGDPQSSSRSYRSESLVLQTEYVLPTGRVQVVDFMPPRGPEREVIRIVRGLEGSVGMHMEFAARFDYGSLRPWIHTIPRGMAAVGGPDAVRLITDVELHVAFQTVVADFTVSAGEEVPLVLSWYPSHRPAPEPQDPFLALAETEDYWRTWSSQCTYTGEYRQAVTRSLITLKALTYAPTGGIVAAATTSLPERLGGVRNWDYRYCWLRDATLTLDSLVLSGFTDEARAWRDWLLRTVAGSPAELQIMYGAAGERRLPELVLPWLSGYEHSTPVRIGNAAVDQHQLDVFGEVIDTMYGARVAGLPYEDHFWALERALLEHLESNWREPDHGIWEVRGPRRQFTHSKVMAWVAFDRAVRSVEQFGLTGPVDHWRGARAEIHDEVCREGFDSGLNSFVQYYGGTHLDASLLMIPLVGFLPADDPRVVGTVEAIDKRLMTEGFVRRYEPDEDVDGLPPGEGAFLACTFWFADNLALMGRVDEAREIFERLLGLCNDVGLLSEQYDPVAHRLLGNFPQAFSHVSLINTAARLSAAPRLVDQTLRAPDSHLPDSHLPDSQSHDSRTHDGRTHDSRAGDKPTRLGAPRKGLE